MHRYPNSEGAEIEPRQSAPHALKIVPAEQHKSNDRRQNVTRKAYVRKG